MTAGTLEDALLEAIPAPASRLLVVGPGLLRHQDIWTMRNPLATVETAAHPWAGPAEEEARPAYDAAILSLDELGEEVTAAIRWVAVRLKTAAPLALFGTTVAAQRFGTALAAIGLFFDRAIGVNATTTLSIERYVRGDAAPAPLCVTAHAINQESGRLSNAVVRVRLLEPLQQLSSLPGVRHQVWSGKGGLAFDRTAANILLVQRQLFFDPDRYLRPFRSNNFITVAEFDDLLLEGGFTLDLYRSNLPRYHAVQASTPALADFLRQFNPEVAVFGNHLPRLRPLQPKSGHPVRLLFAAIGRKEAWQQILPACRDVTAGQGDRVTTLVIGDREFFDALQPVNGQFLPVLDHPDYLAQLERADIALLPLADNRFDRSKSDLKFLECAAAGTAVLASRIVYGESVRNGETGFVYGDSGEFKQQLQALIEDGSLRARLAANARADVAEKRILANHVQRRQAWYRSLVDRRDELNRLIDQRLGRP